MAWGAESPTSFRAGCVFPSVSPVLLLFSRSLEVDSEVSGCALLRSCPTFWPTRPQVQGQLHFASQAASPLGGAFKAQTPRWPNGPLGQAGRGHELSVALSSMFCSPGAELDGQEILWLDRL